MWNIDNYNTVEEIRAYGQGFRDACQLAAVFFAASIIIVAVMFVACALSSSKANQRTTGSCDGTVVAQIDLSTGRNFE
jgi:hypothetical protein